ncbi:MAG: UDP-N-acetylglucosamine--N-acetylmuramyl-(pentapeptide) pyrophosphoryl-undecaprenol N-acetylglucosamine transferase [Candidatus Nealsonbacteria bacterium]
MKKNKRIKILFTGGGTAGHILPIIAVARELRKLNFEANFSYIGPKDSFASLLLSQEGIKVRRIIAGKIRRYFGIKSIFQNVIDILFKMPFSFLQAFFYILFLNPDIVFSKGGYGSFSTVFWSWIFQVPVFLHESDVIPGLANKIMGNFAMEIFVSFSVSQTEFFSKKKMISVGNPVRTEIMEGSEEEAKKIFNLSCEKPVILILGGSQGAQKINDLILAILPEALDKYELIHQCGEKHFKNVSAESKVVIKEGMENYYHLFSFFIEEELKHAYKVADLVVSRAGSGSIFEIAATENPAILIPLPNAAQGHQLKNAYKYVEEGGALVIEESNLTSHFFLERMNYLFSRPDKMRDMQTSAIRFSRPKAAKVIAQYLKDYLRQ